MSKQPVLTDSERLDFLARSSGFVVGMADGRTAYRLLGSDEWHADLRAAVDAQQNAVAADAQDA